MMACKNKSLCTLFYCLKSRDMDNNFGDKKKCNQELVDTLR